MYICTYIFMKEQCRGAAGKEARSMIVRVAYQSIAI